MNHQPQRPTVPAIGVVVLCGLVLVGSSFAAGATSPVNPCPLSAIEIDATSVDAVVNRPAQVLKDADGFWRNDAAYALAARWHAINSVEIPWDSWRQQLGRYAELTEAERTADPTVQLVGELVHRADAWRAAAIPLVCEFLPSAGAPLDTTVHLSAALKPYSFMTNGQIVVDVTSPVFGNSADTIFDLLTHELFHIGYSWRRSARREVELEDPELYRMLDALQNEGIATYVGERARALYPLASHDDYALLADPDEVRRLLAALNDLFSRAPAMVLEERRAEAWRLGVMQRAYYVVGARMARLIDDTLGRATLVETIVEGPRSFVAVYNRIAPADMTVTELPPPAAAPPSHALRLAALDEDPTALQAAVDELRWSRPVDAPGLEAAVNAIGYRLLRAGQVDDASAVLGLGVERHRRQLTDIVAVVNLDTLGGRSGPEIGTAAAVDEPAAEGRVDVTPPELRHIAWEGGDGRWRILHPQVLELATRSNSPEWLEKESAAAAAEAGVELVRRDLMSDHRSLTRAGVPATSIQSGGHTIHSPDDRADRLEIATVDAACRVAAGLVRRLATAP